VPGIARGQPQPARGAENLAGFIDGACFSWSALRGCFCAGTSAVTTVSKFTAVVVPWDQVPATRPRLMLAASNWPREARAEGTDDLARLRTQVMQLYSKGKYAEAMPIAERYVAMARKKHGENHTEYSTAIVKLAHLYVAQGRAILVRAPLTGRRTGLDGYD